MKDVTYDVGVIIGRFQVPTLHEGHRELIQAVCDRHDKVIIFLGLSPLMVTMNNPLDFEARKQMILSVFPNVNVLYVKDMYDDAIWSKKLDEQVEDLLHANQSVILYGGRDSFIPHYSGKYPTQALEPTVYTSGKEVRKAIKQRSTKASEDFRAGVVWAAQAQFPTSYTTVDIGIFDDNYKNILLARKEHEPQHRLVGGFSHPESFSFEQDARREVNEETHLDVTDPFYIGSFLIDDWRYRGEVDSIKTLLFRCKIFSGRPRPDDDIAELKWFDIEYLDIENQVVPNHRELVKRLCASLGVDNSLGIKVKSD